MTTSQGSESTSEKVHLINRNNNTVPLQACNLKMIVELTGGYCGKDRLGLDLVAVLDVSGSMKGDKIAKVITAMLFVISKLSPIDNLSAVTFSAQACVLWSLRQMTTECQSELKRKISGLQADGWTNMAAGLQAGIQVLNGRNACTDRVGAVMLMSDGDENIGKVADVEVGNVPVFTFGFGVDHKPEVLKDIAYKSKGGTFSDVQNTDNLTKAFSMCLAGLQTVVVQDLKLSVTPLNGSIIRELSAGDYPISTDADGSRTVTYKDLYGNEVRKVIVELLLPAANCEGFVDVLKLAYSHSCGGSPIEATLTVHRIGKTTDQEERPEVTMEEIRIQIVKLIKDILDNKFDNARDKVKEACELLKKAVEDFNPTANAILSDLEVMLKLMDSKEKKWRSFAHSCQTSHDRQRFAARGDDVECLQLFATPRMKIYLEQAKCFDKNPVKPLPSASEDAEKELKDNPFSRIAGALKNQFEAAIKSLQAIEHVLKTEDGDSKMVIRLYIQPSIRALRAIIAKIEASGIPKSHVKALVTQITPVIQSFQGLEEMIKSGSIDPGAVSLYTQPSICDLQTMERIISGET